MNSKVLVKVLIFIISICIVSQASAAGEWYLLYEQGVSAMEKGDYKSAEKLFRQAIAGNPAEKKKIRTYGMHFIEYFPHRELGICLYKLGDTAGAQIELKRSLQDEPSDRANEYMRQISGGVPAPAPAKVEEVTQSQTPSSTPRRRGNSNMGVGAAITTGAVAVASSQPSSENEMIVAKKTVKEVGERMGVAVLPFENKGASRDLGEIILDKMITVLWNQGRFKVMERAALDKIIAEQSLGQTGMIDAATVAEIGKGIGVDAIIYGSVAASTSGALSIDVRVIDTESAAIIVAHDAYTGSSDAQSVKNAVENLARKITESLPLVEGYVIKIEGEKLLLDVGRIGGLKKGMKCIIYKEGETVKHPITGEIYGKETTILAEVFVTEAFEKYSVAKQLTFQGGVISIGDKFITK